MCGRYSFAMEDALILERFGIRVRTAIYKARYNCSPTQNLAVIANDAPDTLKFFRWGLIPSWSKDPAGGSKLINARAETLAEKPSFKNAFRNRRCLVPATGFYEWKRDHHKDIARNISRPFHIGMKNGDPFCFAGLWDRWVSGEGEIMHSFTIITTSPNKLMEPIHDRMPVILHREDEQRWISSQMESSSLADLLKPYPAEMMEAWPVSTLVNSPKNDGPEIIGRAPDLML
ncbi:MAG: SOS response-associated peptidase [Bacteroidetes bacterium]|nr:SOS response-associated peptidase [Bacteroidota bacterium]